MADDSNSFLPEVKCAVASQRDDLLALLEEVLVLIEDEAENRSAAGSVCSDYEREPRDLADRIRAAIAKAEG